MKKLVLIALLASLLPYSTSHAQYSSYSLERLLETQLYAQNSNQLISIGSTGLIGWLMLPYCSCSFKYKSTQNGKITEAITFSFDGEKAQELTKYTVLPLSIAYLTAGLYGMLNK